MSAGEGRHTVTKLGGKCWHGACSYRCSCVWAEDGAGKWCPPAPLSLVKFPQNLHPSGSCSDVSKESSLVYTTGVFPSAASIAVSPRGCLSYSLSMGTQFPISLLQILKF